ncbi:MAG: ParB/RepB/Spo0J family partition protein [Bacteroidales bacterium]|jgi:ParB family chromosome partitioning protein|nr:ParB/RepB/Spo0J family partition protein [Bacteroidales bacterium]
MSKTPAMGRGLDSLMGNLEARPKRHHSEILETTVVGSIAEISIKEIDTNPENPRKDFPKDYLDELATSIQTYGIIQPITVRKNQGRYQIISGECRYRAAKIAGLKTMPAYIRVATDMETLEMAVSENIQRENLNPIEIAITYKALIDGQNLTQEELSKRLGKSRPLIANHLRLLKLPAEIQLALQSEQISMGQAKPLISLGNDEKRLEILHRILKEGLSARQVEELMQTPEIIEKPKKQSNATISDRLIQTHDDLSQKLAAAVRYKISKTGKGQIVIEFNSEEDFHRIVSMLK